jgi:hypothetical protein
MKRTLLILSTLTLSLLLSFGFAASPAQAFDLNDKCKRTGSSLNDQGWIAGCKIGYPGGYYDGLGAYPSEKNLTCTFTAGSDAYGSGKTAGCTEGYNTGFKDGDTELATDSSVSDCPANLKKTAAPSSPGAGAYNAGCNDGYVEGFGGVEFPDWCESGPYQQFSDLYVAGCNAGHQAGVAALAGTPGDPPPPPYTGDNQLIVQFGGLTRNDVPISTYINSVYKWSIGLAALLAVFQIAYGGVLYVLAAGSLYSQEEATGKMKNAASGLLLLLAITLILNVINPRLTFLNPDSNATAPWWMRVPSVTNPITGGSLIGG